MIEAIIAAVLTILAAILPPLMAHVAEAKIARAPQKAIDDANELVSNPDSTELARRLSELHDKASRRRYS